MAESPAMTTTPRIAIVEDDHDLLLSTQEFLAAAGYPVWGAETAEAFYRRFVVDPVDVVILDIGLPGEDGLSVAQLLQANPAIAVIILSARDAVEDRLAGLRAGADQYLVKPVNLLELAANIDAVGKRLNLTKARPQLELPHQTRRTVDSKTDTGDVSAYWSLSVQDWYLKSPEGDMLKLTAREFAVLHHLIRVQGQAVPKRQLADEIFGARILNSGERLNVLIARLRKKGLETLNQELPIKTVHQLGYAFTAPVSLGL